MFTGANSGGRFESCTDWLRVMHTASRLHHGPQCSRHNALVYLVGWCTILTEFLRLLRNGTTSHLWTKPTLAFTAGQSERRTTVEPSHSSRSEGLDVWHSICNVFILYMCYVHVCMSVSSVASVVASGMCVRTGISPDLHPWTSSLV